MLLSSGSCSKTTIGCLVCLFANDHMTKVVMTVLFLLTEGLRYPGQGSVA